VSGTIIFTKPRMSWGLGTVHWGRNCSNKAPTRGQALRAPVTI